jgi:hypothetical protein
MACATASRVRVDASATQPWHGPLPAGGRLPAPPGAKPRLPTSRPEHFTYKIVYTPDGDPSEVTLMDWTITGADRCDPAPLRGGRPCRQWRERNTVLAPTR